MGCGKENRKEKECENVSLVVVVLVVVMMMLVVVVCGKNGFFSKKENTRKQHVCWTCSDEFLVSELSMICVHKRMVIKNKETYCVVDNICTKYLFTLLILKMIFWGIWKMLKKRKELTWLPLFLVRWNLIDLLNKYTSQKESEEAFKEEKRKKKKWRKWINICYLLKKKMKKERWRKKERKGKGEEREKRKKEKLYWSKIGVTYLTQSSLSSSSESVLQSSHASKHKLSSELYKTIRLKWRIIRW